MIKKSSGKTWICFFFSALPKYRFGFCFRQVLGIKRLVLWGKKMWSGNTLMLSVYLNLFHNVSVFLFLSPSKCNALYDLPPGLQTDWHYWQLLCERYYRSHQHIWWKSCTGTPERLASIQEYQLSSCFNSIFFKFQLDCQFVLMFNSWIEQR